MPEGTQGSVQIEKEGMVTWEYSGSLDDAGIVGLAGVAIHALRACGSPREME
jgi:hypothetical protein